MLRSDTSIRFTANEVREALELGIDLDGVKSPDDFANALIPWVETLGELHPDLLLRLAQDLAKAKGVELPPRLSVVPSSNCPE